MVGWRTETGIASFSSATREASPDARRTAGCQAALSRRITEQLQKWAEATHVKNRGPNCDQPALVGSLVMPKRREFMRTTVIELDIDFFRSHGAAIIEEGFDAVLRTGEPTDSRLISKRLGAATVVVQLTTTQHVGMPKALADLASHYHACCWFPSTGKVEPWPLAGNFELPQTMVQHD